MGAIKINISFLNENYPCDKIQPEIETISYYVTYLCFSRHAPRKTSIRKSSPKSTGNKTVITFKSVDLSMPTKMLHITSILDNNKNLNCRLRCASVTTNYDPRRKRTGGGGSCSVVEK